MTRKSRLLCAIILMPALWALSGTAGAETALITGANQGIGLEFAKQYAARAGR